MKKSIFVILCLVYISKTSALDGVAVGVNSQTTGAYGKHYGNIRAYIIQNSTVTSVRDIYTGGDARTVSLRTDGKQIAFFKVATRSAEIVVMDLKEGATPSSLLITTRAAWLNWPMPDYVYFADWGSSILQRVHVKTKIVDTVGSFSDDTKLNHFSIARDGKRGATCHDGWNSCSFSISAGALVKQACHLGCGASMSPDGTKITRNDRGHVATTIFDFEGNEVGRWGTEECADAGGWWNRQHWSKSNDWVCFTQGGGGSAPRQLEGYHNIVLYKVSDNGKTNIQLTFNTEADGGYDEADDFWEGNPGTVFGSGPAIGLSSKNLTFHADIAQGINPAPQNLIIGNEGMLGTTLPDLSAQPDKDWLSTTVINNKEIKNAIDLTRVPVGIHTATVIVTGSGVDTVSYTVKLVYKAPQVFTTLAISSPSDRVLPQSISVLRAIALDQDGDPLVSQPDNIQWSVEGEGKINTRGVYTAPAQTGGPYTITAKANIGDVALSGTKKISVSWTILKLNCGSEEAVEDWVSERYSQNGKNYPNKNTPTIIGIVNPAPPAVYQTVREASPTYTFPKSLVANGEYIVRLHFNEGNRIGRSKVDVIIESEKVLSLLKIDEEAGGLNMGLVKEFKVGVNNGNGMTISFAAEGGTGGKVSGIEIIVDSMGFEPLTESIRITGPRNGDTFAIGEIVPITWASTNIFAVLVKISINGGYWQNIITPGTAREALVIEKSGGAFLWTVPETFNGTTLKDANVMISVEDYTNADIYGEMDGAITITEATQISKLNKSPYGPGMHIRSLKNGNVGVIINNTTQPSNLSLYSLNGRCILHRQMQETGTHILDMRNIGASVRILEINTGDNTRRLKYLRN